MHEFFLAAFSFGLVAGLGPGPLSIIVIQHTLAKGLLDGLRASLAPLITDGPIILAALYLLSHFKNIDLFTASLSLLGGSYLLLMGYKIIRIQEFAIAAKLNIKDSLNTAIKVNFLNPSPYVFWFTVGGSYILRGTMAENLVFIITAIITLVVSKMSIALLAMFFKPWLEGKGYLITLRVLASILMGFGLASLFRAYSLLIPYLGQLVH